MQQQPVIVLSKLDKCRIIDTKTERTQGRSAQNANIVAGKTVSDIIRTCLGPRAMLKMLLDPMGGIVLTNDGNAILREVEVAHPAAKSMIEIARTQDEEVGDGTTQSATCLEKNVHPVIIIKAYKKALEESLKVIEEISLKVDVSKEEEVLKVIKSCIGTKFSSRWSDLMCSLAFKAVKTVSIDNDGVKEIDIKRYARVEKIPGGEIEQSEVLDGIILNKDVTHPKMKRRIENPRIILLDCPLEYKKGESQTNLEFSKEEDFARVLQIEEEQIKEICEKIISLKPDIVITEKGVSDLAQHYFVKANITALRRVRKTDNHRISRAVGATIVNKVDDLKESDVGTKCGLFYIDKIGDEYFSYFVKCKEPKACSIILRGASKDILHEIDRNLQDAMAVARNIVFNPKLSPGGGATEMALSVKLAQKAKEIGGIEQFPFKALAEAFEVIPRTLIQNCGGNVIRLLTLLRSKHASNQGSSFGVDGCDGKIVDMKDYGIWEPSAVKIQTIKTAIESACLLLRVDDIVSGVSRKDKSTQPQQQPQPEEAEQPER
ncbi:T-complex protein 1 subunit gamma [Rozella allomycis CSF55]|uniref:T-complex protein 1 subunit gamma n=1 Tax=Rozella allomycis (strain CSF55) TaxID=988480 RepID=A0A075AT91_ROZAC|nr:T-complex protein 1 subunit gamma [Rozella allomycis CSF55]RKP22156.1 T-complex protein 1 subunit gamma [Rozella allomycis CSF55]|eukprot:EPZ31733.1 T-complex protein 1 subunit gamma [Rozella allomycis CSF55]